MTPRDAITLVTSALRSVQYVLDGRVQFPHGRLGDSLVTDDGRTFVVYRETVLRPAVEEHRSDGVVLVFEMRVDVPEAGETVRGALFNPLANVATPFFAGMSGFRRKVWLSGRRPEEFLELYEWESRRDADRFVEVLESLLAPFDFAGEASFEVVESDTVDEYVAAHASAWHDADADGDGDAETDEDGETQTVRAPPRRSVAALLVVLAVLLGAYLVSRGGRDGVSGRPQ